MSPDSTPLGHRDAQRFSASLPPDAYARLVEATIGEAREAGHLVVLGRQSSEPGPEVVEAVGRILGLDPYSARQRLLSPAPRIIRREQSSAAAERGVAELCAVGARAFRISEKAFFQFHPVRVLAIDSGHGVLDLQLPGGRTERLEPGDLLCAVRGRVRARVETEEERGKLFGLGGVLRKETLRYEIEDIVDLHLGRVPVIFRVIQSDLVNSARGVRSLNQLMTDLQCDFPAVPRVDNFDQAEAIMGQNRRTTAKETLFDYRLLGGAGSHGGRINSTTQSNDAFEAFDLFSLLTRMQLLRT